MGELGKWWGVRRGGREGKVGGAESPQPQHQHGRGDGRAGGGGRPSSPINTAANTATAFVVALRRLPLPLSPLSLPLHPTPTFSAPCPFTSSYFLQSQIFPLTRLTISSSTTPPYDDTSMARSFWFYFQHLYYYWIPMSPCYFPYSHQALPAISTS